MKELMKRWYLIVIVILVVVPTVYFAINIEDQEFRDGAIGNWFATMIGVIVGIPIALEINRRQEASQEAKRKRDMEIEAGKRKSKILKLVRAELRYNLDQLSESTFEEDGITKRKVLINGLKDELWASFSDSGELQWIRDLDLLHGVSFAYHYIRQEKLIEKMYLEEKRPPTFIQSTANQRIEWLMMIDSPTQTCIEQALELIEVALSNSKT